MLSWCAYCQEFIKEVPPFEQLSITHGLCESCTQRGLFLDDLCWARLHKLVNLQRELYAAGSKGDISQIDGLIKKSQSLGVKPLDMVFGFLNPKLVHIGDLWEKGLLSVRDEHKFSNFAENIFQSLLKTQGGPMQPTPSVLLVSAEGNYHTFGLQALRLWLQAEGIASELIIPSFPTDELIEYTLKNKPHFVCLSVSLLSHIASVKKYLDAMKMELARKDFTVLIGGFAVKSGLIKASELAPAVLVNDLKDLTKIINFK